MMHFTLFYEHVILNALSFKKETIKLNRTHHKGEPWLRLSIYSKPFEPVR